MQLGTDHALFACGPQSDNSSGTTVFAAIVQRRRPANLQFASFPRISANRDRIASHHGPDGLTIDDVDMSDSLMMQGGIERRCGSVVVHDACPAERFTDTAAFEECLKRLAARARSMGLA